MDFKVYGLNDPFQYNLVAEFSGKDEEEVKQKIRTIKKTFTNAFGWHPMRIEIANCKDGITFWIAAAELTKYMWEVDVS